MHKKLHVKNIFFIASLSVICIALISCSSTAIKPANSNVRVLHASSLNIDSLTPKKIKVSAEKSWQSSGIFLENGEKATVTASGKWSPAPLLLQWSGAEGSSFFGSEVPYITGGALMAKLGHDGTAFEIGISATFQANDYGMLYLAMNDPFKWQFDNSGELDVAIYTGNNSSTNKPGSSQPTEITSYSYDDRSGKGSLSARVTSDHFKTRNWMIKKIGEIASSKRVALHAGKESLKGGNYQVLDEGTENGVLTINFETLW